MIFKELDLLDKDDEIEASKVAPFVDAQMKIFSENSQNNTAITPKWNLIFKESFDFCIKKSKEKPYMIDYDKEKHTTVKIRSADENLEPILVMTCINTYTIAVFYIS